MDSFYRRLEAALAPAYTIERELMGGGMSHVYLATEKALGRSVVVKVLPPELAAGVNRERFRREIHLAAQLQHPHIVPLLTAGEDGDLLYYTMPFVSGESLRVRLEERGRLPVKDVVRILTDVVDALAYAHARGVVHRDIKPGNVLTQSSHALVTDFGVAKAISAALPSAGATTSGLAIGTPAYMAPEQLAADPAADHRVDLYAVGLLAYELLSGEAPFAGASPTATMAAQLTRDPDPIESHRPDVPAALSAIITHCLAKDPERRPPNADVLLTELEELASLGFTTPVAAGRPASPRIGVRQAGLLAGGMAALLLVGALLSRQVGRMSEGAMRDSLPSVLAGDSARPITLDGDTGTDAPDTAPASAPDAAGTVLTRADSMAIAEAVQRRLASERSRRGARAEAVDEDSIEQLVSRFMVDSLLKVSEAAVRERLSVLRGLHGRIITMPEPGEAHTWSWSGPRPVVIVPVGREASPEGELQRMVADTLRAVMARTENLLPINPGEEPEGSPPGIGIIATVGLTPLPGDSVRAHIELVDPLAPPELMHRVVRGRPMARSEAARSARPLATSAVATLRQMSRSARSAPRFQFVVPPAPPDPGP